MGHGRGITVHLVLGPFYFGTNCRFQSDGCSESVYRYLGHGDTAERSPQSGMKSRSAEVKNGDLEGGSKNLRERHRTEVAQVEAEAYLKVEEVVGYCILVGRMTSCKGCGENGVFARLPGYL